MKRRWTIESAMDWVKRVEDGKEKLGLKYCSARSFLLGRMKAAKKEQGNASA